MARYLCPAKAGGREVFVKKKKRCKHHLAKAVGLGLYILVATAASVAAVYGAVSTVYDLVLDVTVSMAHLVAAIAGWLVCYGLYVTYADEIEDSFRQLFNHLSSLRLTVILVPSAAFVVLIAFALVNSIPELRPRAEIGTKPAPAEIATVSRVQGTHLNETAKNPETDRVPLTDLESILALAGATRPFDSPASQTDESATSVASSDRSADPCDLKETFSAGELQACEQDHRRHPTKKGIGGPAYDLGKDGNFRKLPERQPANSKLQKRRPLDIKPSLKRHESKPG
jgi:hypothetical protein